MSDVHVWVLAHQSWNIFKPMEYYCLVPGPILSESTTQNVKLAHRFFDYEDAQDVASYLSKKWTPRLVVFKGDEPAYVQA